MPGGGFDPYTDEPGDILYGPSDQFGFTAWSHSDIITWRWFGNFTPGHNVDTRALQKIGRKRLAQLQLRIRLASDSNLGMGKQVWHERTGEVITAITRPGHDEVWIEASPGAKLEEEREDKYFPYIWVGARIKAGTATCTDSSGSVSPEVHLFMWEPPDSAPESARLRSQGPGQSRAGLTTQVVGAVYNSPSLQCDLGMGTKPIGDTTSIETPSVSSAVGSVPTTRTFRTFNCDDQEIVLEGEDSFGSEDGIYVPSCCLPAETFTFNFQDCTRYLPQCVTFSGTAVDPGAPDLAGEPINHLATDSIHYTDSGLVFSAMGVSYDPQQDEDAPDPTKSWGETIYVDPDDPVKQFKNSRPYAFFAGAVTETESTEFNGPAPTWSLPGKVLGGNYVLKVCMSGYPCCAPFPTGKGGGGATIEIEVRLGKEPGRTLVTNYEVLIGAQSSTFKNLIPYGWFGGFALEGIRELGQFSAGPCNPNDEGNWWSDALLINGDVGAVEVEENYWLDGQLPDDEFYEIETYPGFFDKPFDTASWISDFCETCEFECIPEPLNCDGGGACSAFFVQPIDTPSGRLTYPAYLIFHRAIVICIEPVDGNCRRPTDVFGNPDPYLGRNKPTRIQIVNNCSTPGPNQVGDCEPLGNGSIFNISTDESAWSTFTAAHKWQLGDVAFVTGTNPNNVFIAPEGAPEIASNLFINSNLICPILDDGGVPKETDGNGPHGNFLASMGIEETQCVDGVETVTRYLGVAV